MNRYVIIGDIHGNYKGVKKLLNSIEYQPSSDILIFVGDYTDYNNILGYSSKKTIDLLLELNQKSNNTYFLLGNHDLWLREWFDKGGIPHTVWIKQGARETFESYGIYNLNDAENQISKIPKIHIDFYKNIIQDYYYDENIVSIHGGFTNAGQMKTISLNKSMPHEQLYQMIWDRRFIFTKLQEEKIMFNQYFNDRFLVVGHTPYGPYRSKLNDKWILIDGNSKMGKKQLGVIIEGNKSYFVNEDGFL